MPYIKCPFCNKRHRANEKAKHLKSCVRYRRFRQAESKVNKQVIEEIPIIEEVKPKTKKVKKWRN